MDKDRQLTLWFDEIGIGDVPLVGGKNASLGEMYRNPGALPSPPPPTATSSPRPGLSRPSRMPSRGSIPMTWQTWESGEKGYGS